MLLKKRTTTVSNIENIKQVMANELKIKMTLSYQIEIITQSELFLKKKKNPIDVPKEMCI